MSFNFFHANKSVYFLIKFDFSFCLGVKLFFNNSLAISDIKIQQLFVNLSQTAQNHYYLKIPIKISTFHSQKQNIFFVFYANYFGTELSRVNSADPLKF